MASDENVRMQRDGQPLLAQPVSGVTSKFILIAFMVSFLIPADIQVGSLKLGFPKLFLLIAFIPTFVHFFKSSSIRFNWVDGLVFGFIFWISLAIFANHGLTRIEFVGLQIVEMLGGYIVARVFVRTLADYEYFWKVFGICMICTLPFAVIELVTDQVLLIKMVEPFFTAFQDVSIYYTHDRRFGFDRVQGNFEHPILFGVFWSLGFATLLAIHKRPFFKLMFGGGAAVMVGLSISSGAYLALIFQLALMFWGKVTKNSWKALLILFILLYLVVEVASNRPALVAISTRLAFRKESAYWRIHIWNYGSQNVWDNPIFGIGLNDWVRPVWLASTVDNHWLLVAMQGGLPAITLLLSSFIVMLWQLTRRQDLPLAAVPYRRAYVITFVAMFIALSTVAVWSGTESFLLFMLGLGVCLGNLPAQAEQGADLPAVEPDKRVQTSPRQRARAASMVSENPVGRVPPPTQRGLPPRTAQSGADGGD